MKKKPEPKSHQLEPVLREMVDQLTMIADAAKAGAVRFPPNDLPPLDPTPTLDPVDPPPLPPVPPAPPPPPPPLCTCDCSGFCDFVKTKPLVKSRPFWNPDLTPPGWDWDAL